MLKKAVPNLKRWVSGYLVAVMTLMLVFNNSFAFSALAAETAMLKKKRVLLMHLKTARFP